ncbi:MAG: hypothetical protein WCL54_06000 [Clostridia bacterium]
MGEYIGYAGMASVSILLIFICIAILRDFRVLKNAKFESRSLLPKKRENYLLSAIFIILSSRLIIFSYLIMTYTFSCKGKSIFDLGFLLDAFSTVPHEQELFYFIINNCAFILSAILLFLIVEKKWNNGVALNTIAIFCCLPFTVLNVMPRTNAIILLLSILCYGLSMRRKWAFAVIVAAFAVLIDGRMLLLTGVILNEMRIAKINPKKDLMPYLFAVTPPIILLIFCFFSPRGNLLIPFYQPFVIEGNELKTVINFIPILIYCMSAIFVFFFHYNRKQNSTVAILLIFTCMIGVFSFKAGPIFEFALPLALALTLNKWVTRVSLVFAMIFLAVGLTIFMTYIAAGRGVYY